MTYDTKKGRALAAEAAGAMVGERLIDEALDHLENDCPQCGGRLDGVGGPTNKCECGDGPWVLSTTGEMLKDALVAARDARNNLPTVASELEAACAEVERLRSDGMQAAIDWLQAEMDERRGSIDLHMHGGTALSAECMELIDEHNALARVQSYMINRDDAPDALLGDGHDR